MLSPWYPSSSASRAFAQQYSSPRSCEGNGKPGEGGACEFSLHYSWATCEPCSFHERAGLALWTGTPLSSHLTPWDPSQAHGRLVPACAAHLGVSVSRCTTFL